LLFSNLLVYEIEALGVVLAGSTSALIYVYGVGAAGVARQALAVVAVDEVVALTARLTRRRGTLVNIHLTKLA